MFSQDSEIDRWKWNQWFRPFPSNIMIIVRTPLKTSHHHLKRKERNPRQRRRRRRESQRTFINARCQSQTIATSLSEQRKHNMWVAEKSKMEVDSMSLLVYWNQHMTCTKEKRWAQIRRSQSSLRSLLQFAQGRKADELMIGCPSLFRHSRRQCWVLKVIFRRITYLQVERNEIRLLQWNIGLLVKLLEIQTWRDLPLT